MQTFLNDYIKEQSENMLKSPVMLLEKACHVLLQAREKGSTIFICGNGGSAATASHFVNDLVKGLSMPGKKRIKSLCLCDQVSLITALANDIDYSEIFSQQLENYAQKEDVLIVISGSGNSPNIVKAMEFSKRLGMMIVGFTGKNGGKVAQLADICLKTETNCMEKIEDIHMFWEHAIITTMKNKIESEA